MATLALGTLCTVGFIAVVLLLGWAVVTSLGCATAGPSPGGVTPEAPDPIKTTVSVLAATDSTAVLVRDFAVGVGNFPACVAGESIHAAAASAKPVVEARGFLIPGVNVDLSVCYAIDGAPGLGSPVSDKDAAVVHAIIRGVSGPLAELVGQVVADSDVDCTGKVIAAAALDAIAGIGPALSDELIHTDGKFSTGDVVIDVAVCSDAPLAGEVDAE